MVELFFMECRKESNGCTSNAPNAFILQEFEKKSRQMTSQDFGSLCNLVNTTALTSYDIDLEARTWLSLMASYRDPLCTHLDGFEKKKGLQENNF